MLNNLADDKDLDMNENEDFDLDSSSDDLDGGKGSGGVDDLIGEGHSRGYVTHNDI